MRKYGLRKRVVRRRRYGAKSKMLRVRRRVLNPTPTFVETFKDTHPIIFDGTSLTASRAFKVRITDIPQINQYSTLYTQYRINWVKVFMLPKLNTSVADANTALITNHDLSGNYYFANVRIASAVQDSPNEVAPASEDIVLQMNGCKIKNIRNYWSQSFKPVPDVLMGVDGGQSIATKQRYRQWFNFDTTTTGNNPEHGAVAAFLTYMGVPGPNVQQVYHVYYKVNFTLRDPQ